MDEADELVPARSAGVFVRSPTARWRPLRYSAGTAARCDGVGRGAVRQVLGVRGDDAARAARGHPAGRQRRDDRRARARRPARPSSPRRALDLRGRLARHAVQLQAALLFGRVRDTATSEERQRIAREVHDGVAQDVASLGYLVDNLAATATDPAQQRADRAAARRR